MLKGRDRYLMIRTYFNSQRSYLIDLLKGTQEQKKIVDKKCVLNLVQSARSLRRLSRIYFGERDMCRDLFSYFYFCEISTFSYVDTLKCLNSRVTLLDCWINIFLYSS